MNNNEELRKQYIKDKKASIIDHFSKITDIVKLEGVLNDLNNTDLESQELEEIKTSIINKLNELKNESLKETIEEDKKINSNLALFEFIESPKEINDKDNFGFKNDMYYLKFNDNGNIRLFEINNVQNVKSFFMNKDLLKNMTSIDILNNIKPYLNELEKKPLDKEDNLTETKINKEIENIYDENVKNVFSNNIDEVLKERNIINEYINNNGLEQELLTYSLNSKGERLYLLGDKVIKFVGKDREMYFLSENENKKLEPNVNELNNTEFKESNYDKNEKIIPDNLNDLDTEFYINAINYSLDKIYRNESLTEYENKLIEIFLTLCVNSKENEIPISLFEMYDTYYKYLYEYEDYYNENIEVLFKDKIANDKIKEKEQKENKVLVLDDEIGFVNIIYIICSIIIVLLSIAYFVFIKK